MKTLTSFALLPAVVAAVVVGLTGCATSHHEEMHQMQDTKMRTYKETSAVFKPGELQCDVTGLHTLASETPDYLGALRGFGDPTGRRSVLLE